MTTTSIANIKSAKDSIGKVASLFKQAQLDGGTLSPDDVKNLATQAEAVLQDVAGILSKIVEEVPATGGDDLNTDVPPVNAPDPKVGTDPEDAEKEEMKNKIASLEQQLNDITVNNAKEKIASEYASLFDPKVRSAKFASIMKSKEDVKILSAKLEEAKSIMGKSKTANLPDDSWRKPTLFTDETRQKNASMDNAQAPVSYVNI